MKIQQYTKSLYFAMHSKWSEKYLTKCEYQKDGDIRSIADK